MTAARHEAVADIASASRISSPEWLLQIAREYDRKGHLHETVSAYETVIRASEATGDLPIAAEALRRLAVVRQRQQESALARALCARSQAMAEATSAACCSTVACGTSR